MSGWWFSASASSPTRFTNASASTKSSNWNVRSSASSTSLQSAMGHGASIYDRPHLMTASTESASAPRLARKQERRAGRELVLELGLRPAARSPRRRCFLSSRGSHRRRSCSPTRQRGCSPRSRSSEASSSLAALLLQVKTLLDNADGRLARASGRVTLAGRYLDTEADLVVNAALFVALGSLTGQPWLALVAFLALTLVLAVDFNASELHREVRGDARQPPTAAGAVDRERARGRSTAFVFAPQDRLVRALSARRLERALCSPRLPPRRPTLAYHDRFTRRPSSRTSASRRSSPSSASASLLGVPGVYLWLVVAVPRPASSAPAAARAAGATSARAMRRRRSRHRLGDRDRSWDRPRARAAGLRRRRPLPALGRRGGGHAGRGRGARRTRRRASGGRHRQRRRGRPRRAGARRARRSFGPRQQRRQLRLPAARRALTGRRVGRRLRDQPRCDVRDLPRRRSAHARSRRRPDRQPRLRGCAEPRRAAESSPRTRSRRPASSS